MMIASNKRALLVVAHGSRRETSNDEIRNLAKHLARTADSGFGTVSAAFLELAEPSIPEGIERCIQEGASEVIVFPYFLSAGRHVAEDIPAEVRPKQKEHPEVSIIVADYLGVAAGMPAMILGHLAGDD